jgi:hypothetical protein
MHTNHCKAYALETFLAVQRVFERRGFSWMTVAETPAENEPGRVHCRSVILLDGKRVGFFNLKYSRWTKVKRGANGKKTNMHLPVKNSLWLEVIGFEADGTTQTDVVHRSSSFYRGVPGVPVKPLLDVHGNRAMGRPKVRRWATYAAKTLLVHHTNHQAEFIHDQ